MASKTLTVNINSYTDISRLIFRSLPDTINHLNINDTIKLSTGRHKACPLRRQLHLIGDSETIIEGSFKGNYSDSVFENIIFDGVDEFCDVDNLIFRNCQFIMNINGDSCKKILFGLRFICCSAIFQNCIFNIKIANVKRFVMLNGEDSSLTLMSPIIRVDYKNVCRMDTFLLCNGMFESFSSSITYTNIGESKHQNDGHCCMDKYNTCDLTHCGEYHSNNSCKCAHTCCDKKCKYRNNSAIIRLFRGIKNVISSLSSTKILFKNGRGFFDIADGDSITYINGLTAIATCFHDWKMRYFTKILLKSFMSNLLQACDIPECGCVDSSCETESESYSDDIPCNRGNIIVPN